MNTAKRIIGTCLLFPGGAYTFAVWARNGLYATHLLKERRYDFPVISIGNLQVGGTGKTPMTEYLISLLKERYRVAVLSRGYKRKSRGYILATHSHKVEDLGDEPYQLYSKFPEISLAVDANRVRAITRLRGLGNAPDVYLMDDGYQYRSIKAGMCVLLTQYGKLFCDDRILPIGRLREPQRQKKRADIVVVTKCPPEMTMDECERIRQKLGLLPHQSLYFAYISYMALRPAYSLATTAEDTLLNPEVLLVTGISNPRPLVEELSKRYKSLTHFNYSDHHRYTNKEMDRIHAWYKAHNNGIIVTTEKDITRFHPHKDIKKQIYIIPIGVRFLFGQGEEFNLKITQYVKQFT